MQCWYVVASHSLHRKKYYIFYTTRIRAYIWTHFSQLLRKIFWSGFNYYSSFNSNNIIIILKKKKKNPVTYFSKWLLPLFHKSFKYFIIIQYTCSARYCIPRNVKTINDIEVHYPRHKLSKSFPSFSYWVRKLTAAFMQFFRWSSKRCRRTHHKQTLHISRYCNTQTILFPQWLRVNSVLPIRYHSTHISKARNTLPWCNVIQRHDTVWCN